MYVGRCFGRSLQKFFSNCFNFLSGVGKRTLSEREVEGGGVGCLKREANV